MSIFSHLMSDASDALVDILGERDKHGDLATITYKPPVGEVVGLVGVIVGPLKQELRENSLGETISAETCWIDFTRDQLGDLPIPLPEKGKFAIREYGGASFRVDDVGSDYGGVMIRVGLKRAPMTSTGQKRENVNG